MPNTNIVIIGSGLAALVTASRLCTNKNVMIFTKSTRFNSNSMLAQGGVASVVSRDDHWTSHQTDTIAAGCNHNNPSMVETLVKLGPSYISDLIKNGMQFDLDETGQLHLGQEGAHSFRRILHAGGDATGKALITFLQWQLSQKVTIIENEMSIDLIVEKGECKGVTALTEQNELITYYADQVILATGGCGGVFEYTSNDTSIIGDGYAMAYRAGVDLVDMEFVQFHPTLLYVNGKCPGLISEAVRGEGAILINGSGKQVMKGKHSLKDLAPRDIVSRAIYEEVQKGNQVFLDISMIEQFDERFPTITQLCEQNGISTKKGRIPVVPGAHFMMGGIKVNEHGESSLPNLYAVGEVACTGVHGANRLASNSLLEGIVFANLLADHILLKPSINNTIQNTFGLETINVNVTNLPSKCQIQNIMMKKVGIVRDKLRLIEAVNLLEPYISLSVQEVGLTREAVSQLNMITTGWLIASSALKREESRGGHSRIDFPSKSNEWEQRQIIRNRREHAYVY
jgi:L-aspartate oxidase